MRFNSFTTFRISISSSSQNWPRNCSRFRTIRFFHVHRIFALFPCFLGLSEEGGSIANDSNKQIPLYMTYQNTIFIRELPSWCAREEKKTTPEAPETLVAIFPKSWSLLWTYVYPSLVHLQLLLHILTHFLSLYYPRQTLERICAWWYVSRRCCVICFLAGFFQKKVLIAKKKLIFKKKFNNENFKDIKPINTFQMGRFTNGIYHLSIM